jgi:hypothetical protein
MISILSRGAVDFGAVALDTEAMILLAPLVLKATSINDMVMTRPYFGCYRLVEAEDDPLTEFESRCQLCAGP